MITLDSCLICGAATETGKTVFETDESITGETFVSRLLECPSCHHVFLNPQPIWEELERFYGSSYHCYTEDSESIGTNLSHPSENSTHQEISHIPIIPGGRFLDVGCGIGNLVAAMTALGMEAEGVEPSSAAAQKAQSLHRKVFCGTLHEAKYQDNTFDSMSMIHVLEHVPDPIALLDECYRILKPNGILTIGVPNFDSLVFRYIGRYWIGLQLPTHLHHFRRDSLSKAARCAKFSVIKLFTESLIPHVELELIKWIRLRFFIPQRLLLKTRLVRPLANYVAHQGNQTDRGEAIVIQLRKE